MELLLIFIIGIISSLVGSFVSGATSAISLSALLAMGIPPHISLGAYRIGVLGFHLGGLKEFIKAKQVLWHLVIPLSILGIVGGIVGANIVISFDEILLSRVIAIVLLLFIPLTFLNTKLGTESKKITKHHRYIGLLLYLLTSVWAASFSVGIGLFVLYIYLYFFGATILEAKGTSKLPGIVLDVTAIIVFLQSGLINWQYGIALALGMILGALIGAKISLKIGNVWLRNIVLVSIFIVALKILLGH